MPTQTSTSDEEQVLGSTVDTVIDNVTVSQQQAMHSIETAGAAVLEGVTRAQCEIADFVSERIRKDMEAQQELLRCKSLDDIRSVQTRFFKTAMDQYSAEATRLLRLGGETMAKSFDRVAD